MRLKHAVSASGLFFASVFQDQGSLVMAVDPTCTSTTANPIDISIGVDVSCGLLPGGTATCWDTKTNGVTWSTPLTVSNNQAVYQGDYSDTLTKVLVSDWSSNDDASYVCVLTESKLVLCAKVKTTENEPMEIDSPWIVKLTKTDHMGLNDDFLCGGRDIYIEALQQDQVWTICYSTEDWSWVWLATDADWEKRDDEDLEGHFHDFFSSASAGHMCKRMVDGRVDCRGDNTYGQVHPMSPLNFHAVWIEGVLQPVVIDSKAVAIGKEHTCAVKKDNTMWCWGIGYTETVLVEIQDPSPAQILFGVTHNRDIVPSVQVNDGISVPRVVVGGEGFTCYIANNELKCFLVGGEPVKIQLGTSSPSVYTAWAGLNQACVQVNSVNNLPDPGVTYCFSGVDALISGANSYDVNDNDALFAIQSSFFTLPLGCSRNTNCVTTIVGENWGELNHGLELNHIPIDFGEIASVEGADIDSFFGLTYTFHPEQYIPPGEHVAIFVYIVPTERYVSSKDPTVTEQDLTDMDKWVEDHGCVFTLSDAPFSTRLNKQCFDLTKTPGEDDSYSAKVVMRTCLLKTCDEDTEARSIYGTPASPPYTAISMSAAEVFSSVGALDGLVMCPYISLMDFVITVPVGNLVESTRRIDLKWARDDVTDADADTAESAVAINDDLSGDVEWAICDRALNLQLFDNGYDFADCIKHVKSTGNARVVQLSKMAPDDTYNQLAMLFRLSENDRRLVSEGFLTLIPEKTSLNLFHSDFSGSDPKTGASCFSASSNLSVQGCTQVLFSTGARGLKYQLYYDRNGAGADSVRHDFARYEVGFRGELPKFQSYMGCGTGGKFCTIVMELTFKMGTDTTTGTRRLERRQVHLPMRMLGDGDGTDYTVALAQADSVDQGAIASDTSSTSEILPTVATGVGGFVLVSVGVAFLARRRSKEEGEVPAKGYDMEAQPKGANSLRLS